MKKTLTFTIGLFISMLSMAQDTIKIKAFDFKSITRDTIVDFPEPNQSFEKIIMNYGMRCKGARVSTGANRNLGCGEWDYSCNTYVEDRSQSDSLQSTHPDLRISGFSGTSFTYTNNPTFDYFLRLRTHTQGFNVLSEDTFVLNSSSAMHNTILPNTGSNGKLQFIYTVQDLLAMGIGPGDLHSLFFNVNRPFNKRLFVVKIKHYNGISLKSENFQSSGFSEVFSDSLAFNPGWNRIFFNQSFTWNGLNSLLFEIEIKDENSQEMLEVLSFNTDSFSSIGAIEGHYLYLEGDNYVETDNYKGIQGAQARTVSAWVKTTGINGEICSWGTDQSGQKWVFRVNESGQLRLEVNGGSVVGTSDIRDDKWHHVACVLDGNKVSHVRFYIDGVLENNSTLADLVINTGNQFPLRASKGVNNRFFKGGLDELRIWDVALSQAQILESMRDATPILSANLVLHYDFNNHNSTSSVSDLSGKNHSATIIGASQYIPFYSKHLFKDFTPEKRKPLMWFAKGNYNVMFTTDSILDALPHPYYSVNQYAVSPNYKGIQDDKIEILKTDKLWDASLGQKYFSQDNLIYKTENPIATGTLTPKNLNYYRRWPSRLEIMSFVTPYGINLDLGKDGKFWQFDVTDFTPILHGSKRMFLSRGGQNQEEMDIEFWFIKGTPPQKVLSISQIWLTEQIAPNYAQIQENTTYFPPVTIPLDPSVKRLKIRLAITGHGQEGEFIPRIHRISAGNNFYDRRVYKECADNPVYPQGGTWIYDRAGWCPGMATDLSEYDVTKDAENGVIKLDYNVLDGEGDSRYIINNQLVSYGEINHTLDAALLEITHPSNRIEYARTNPICTSPTIVVQNSGKETITSLKINFWVNNESNMQSTTWTGSLAFAEKINIILPENVALWSTANAAINTFSAEITEVNGKKDDYTRNNVYHQNFEKPIVFPEEFVFFHKPNAAASETTIKLLDDKGKVIWDKGIMTNNFLYRDTIRLPLGCYSLLIEDSGDDGISFWANQDGSGFFRVQTLTNQLIAMPNPDFGKFTRINFTVKYALSANNLVTPNLLISPNPSTNNFVISGLDFKDVEVLVLNALGQEITPLIKNFGDKLQVDLSGFPEGMYIAKIRSFGEVYTSKLILTGAK